MVVLVFLFMTAVGCGPSYAGIEAQAAQTHNGIIRDCQRDCSKDQQQAMRSCNERCAQNPNLPDCIPHENDVPSSQMTARDPSGPLTIKSFVSDCFANARTSWANCANQCHADYGEYR
jgi:hypothetical protein